MSDAVITTNPARCRDCYRCVRNCIVKAIRVKAGQAQVVPELCILCGTCVRVCPQKAKDVSSDIHIVKEAILNGRRVIASVAPSAPAFFDMNRFSEIETALKALGFYAAEETAVGAEIVGLAHREYIEKENCRRPVITSSCPVVINIIEQYHPDLIPHLAPIVSPMIAHGRILAEKYGSDAFIVFIGPCIAKKMEIHDAPVAGVINAVMTFQSIGEWFADVNIHLNTTEDVSEAPPAEKARLFPIEGGLIGTAAMNTDILDRGMVVASGLEACQDVLGDIRSGRLNASLVELLACKGGCINGPAFAEMPGGISQARQKIIRFHSRQRKHLAIDRALWPNLERTFSNRKIPVPEFSEEQIQDVLHRVNKFSPEDELNCQACGYSSCREKAVATLRGMAEATMCIPYMRNRSESLRQVVMDVTPDSIIIVDNDLIIHDLSPSSERLFKCKFSDVEGKHLSCLIPVLDDFIFVRDTGSAVMGKARRFGEDLVVEETIVRVEGQLLMVAILRDVTIREKEHAKFKALREEALERTHEVAMKQMRVAHEIAHLLGETTAESKTIVSRLAKLLEEDGNT